jgi:uncharacterized protein
MNAGKVILGAIINGISVVAFAAAGAIAWADAIEMALGASLGGYFAASLARAVAPRHVRRFVLSIAWAMTAFFFAKALYLCP